MRAALATALLLLAGAAPAAARAPRTPVVFFPGYGTTVMKVTVHGQRSVRGCPASGSFGDGLPADVGTTFSLTCRDRLLTPSYAGPRRLPLARRFHLPAGVTVSIPRYGSTASAPVYAPFYDAMAAAGWKAGRDLFVAGYDFRLTPDLGGFMRRTKALIERVARRAGRPVRLVGHSNGPLYAQYLLTHVTAAWKRRHIQGFTSIAGNLPGQGSTWADVFGGLDVSGGFAFPSTPAAARTSARLQWESPSTWMSASDPRYFGRREVVVRDDANGHRYTPADSFRLLRDAGLASVIPLARHYLGFVRFADRRDYPGVDVTAERGSGLPTDVGIALPSLTPGQVVGPAPHWLTRPGDDNQEDLTNAAIEVWRHMRCHRFALADHPRVGHISLPGDPAVIRRLVADLRRPAKRC